MSEIEVLLLEDLLHTAICQVDYVETFLGCCQIYDVCQTVLN